MKKTIFLTSAICLLGANANAFELTPYAGLRIAGIYSNNETNVLSDYSFGGETHHNNTISDTTHSDIHFGGRAAVGAETPIPYGTLRAEAEFGWNSDFTDDNDFPFEITNLYTHNYETTTSIYDAMLNFYYDINTGTKFVPFVNAGIGYAHIKTSSLSTGEALGITINVEQDSIADNFAWNVGAGLAYNLSENIALDIAYRYTNYGTVKDDAAKTIPNLGKKLYLDGEFDISSHEVMIGARYKF